MAILLIKLINPGLFLGTFCLFGCDDSDLIRRKLESIPNVQQATVTKNSGHADVYHAQVVTKDHMEFGIFSITEKTFISSDHFYIYYLNGWAIDSFACFPYPELRREKWNGKLAKGRVAYSGGGMDVGRAGEFGDAVIPPPKNLAELIYALPEINRFLLQIPERPIASSRKINDRLILYYQRIPYSKKYIPGPTHPDSLMDREKEICEIPDKP